MDYCTGWWDGWPTWLGGSGTEWRHCCKAHDAFYHDTMTLAQKVAADAELWACVGGSMGMLMWAGVSTLGLGIMVHLKNRLTKGKDARSVPWRRNGDK